MVITMTKSHRDEVLRMGPRLLRRTFTLTEMALLVSKFDQLALEDLAENRSHLALADLNDIPDPIGQDIQVFETVGFRIAELLVPIVQFCSHIPA